MCLNALFLVRCWLGHEFGSRPKSWKKRSENSNKKVNVDNTDLNLDGKLAASVSVFMRALASHECVCVCM